MASFESALQFVVGPRIQLLENMNTLHQEFERLSDMKKDTKSKLETELQRPGRSSTHQVNTWLGEVEEMENKMEESTNEINQIFAYESTDEGFEELIKEIEKYQREGLPNESRNMVERRTIVEGNVTSIGMGSAAGPTTFHQTNSPTTMNFNITLGNGAVVEGPGKAKAQFRRDTGKGQGS